MLSLIALAIISGPSATHKLVNSNGAICFCDQNGMKYWSLGVCCVNEGIKAETFNPINPGYASYRLFASDKAWVDDTLSKLRSWNINTIGGWSNTSLLLEHNRASCLPYTVVLHLGAYDRAPWEDMFSKEFETICDTAAKEQIVPIVNDPLLVGYFSDNELGWWDDALFLHYLAMPPSSVGKQKLVSLARKQYKSDFALFTKDWITKCHSFDELLAKDTKIFIKPGGNGMRFVNSFTYELAKRYYSVMHRVIRKYDKNRLILGDRYAQYWELSVLKAAKPYVDVISTNYGAEFLDGSLTQYFLSTIFEVTRKPILISEFYWNAMENRSGNKNSTKAFPIVQTQQQRANSLSVNLKNLVSLPYVVGAHWFQFYDEPEKGRADGEDNNMGLVDIHGKPYEQTVSAFKNLDIDKLRAKSISPKTCTVLPRAPIRPLAGLLDWPRLEGWIKPSSKEAFADLYLCYDDEYLFIGTLTMDFVYRDLYENMVIPDTEHPYLELAIGSANTLRLNIMSDMPAKSSGVQNVKIFEIPGIKHVAIAAVPWQSLGGKKTGVLAINGKMYQHSKASMMSWSSKVTVK